MNLPATRLHPSWTMLAGDFDAYPGFDRWPRRPQRQMRMFVGERRCIKIQVGPIALGHNRGGQ